MATDSIASNSSSSSSSSNNSSATMPPKKSKVYTRTGDKGTSSLFNGDRTSKTADFFQALGDTDELNAQIGVAREYARIKQQEDGKLVGLLAEVQSRLFDVGAHLATPNTTSSIAQLERTKFDTHFVEQLERWIDELDAQCEPLRNFVIPGAGLACAHLHVARSIARRAERRIVPLVEAGEVDEAVGIYMNRLSDFFFVAARYASHVEGEPEVLWQKPRRKKE